MKYIGFIAAVVVIITGIAFVINDDKTSISSNSTKVEVQEKDIIEFVSLITNEENSGFAGEFSIAYSNPVRYVSENEGIFEDWFITVEDNSNKEVAMIALYSYLNKKKKSHYIDWDEFADSVFYKVNDILHANGYEQFLLSDELNPDGLYVYSGYIDDSSDKYMSTVELLTYCSTRLSEINVMLICLDIDNDAYEVIAVEKSNVERIQELGRLLGYRIMEVEWA